MAQSDEYICALSGYAAKDEELVEDAGEDDLEEIPVGWLKITVQKRVINPAWQRVNEVKSRQVAMQVDEMKARFAAAQIDDEDAIAMAVGDVEFMVGMSFLPIEREIPKYATQEAELYVRDPSSDKEIAREWRRIADTLEIEIDAG